LSAQELLDDIAAIDIAAICSPSQEPKARADLIKLAEQRLKLIRKQLKDQSKDVAARWDGRNQYEGVMERLELAPYNLVDDQIGEILIFLEEVKIANKGNTRLPLLPYIGTVIIPEINKLVTRAEALEIYALLGKDIRRQLEYHKRQKPKLWSIKANAFVGVLLVLGFVILAGGIFIGISNPQQYADAVDESGLMMNFALLGGIMIVGGFVLGKWMLSTARAEKLTELETKLLSLRDRYEMVKKYRL